MSADTDCREDLHRFLFVFQQAEFLCVGWRNHITQLTQRNGLREGERNMVAAYSNKWKNHSTHPTHEKQENWTYYMFSWSSIKMICVEVACVCIQSWSIDQRHCFVYFFLPLCSVGHEVNEKNSSDRWEWKPNEWTENVCLSIFLIFFLSLVWQTSTCLIRLFDSDILLRMVCPQRFTQSLSDLKVEKSSINLDYSQRWSAFFHIEALRYLLILCDERVPICSTILPLLFVNRKSSKKWRRYLILRCSCRMMINVRIIQKTLWFLWTVLLIWKFFDI